MSWSNRVLWAEGMFLRPQHFQQHDRYLERLVGGRCRALQVGGWGFAELRLDEALLTQGKLAILAARHLLGSARDASLEDFGLFFGTDGVLDTYFRQYLQPYVDTTATPWRWHPGEAERLGIGPGVLQTFQQLGYDHGPSRPVAMQWLGPNRSGPVRLSIAPPGRLPERL
ncbi:Type VI secretion, VC_A0110, EvfL, ImpJ, VasE [Azotobacter beijerinckii]|uniref:Type VI secretion, VC_A0110, EvfL, ImpJ, VasE n=1 Tax=Azotobacter beijerinckii TaxID=170623 RepID=A0A1I4CSB9_9GAMM|nr:Type VI secretion, VC_A0110, EvfL, ImpJ, VasE [Azotobacter beijerinckii]SFK83683.1 Type VI secretion, VC_A0110, EvfL, ImpJ, VasE [Azotobacter beijerinckii]